MAIAFPAENTGLIDELEWIHVSSPGNRPQIEGDSYLPASRFVHFNTQVAGDYLVLQNCFETGDEDEFLLDPDLILGLNLRREGESWVAPYEDYIPVIRMHKGAKGRIDLIEIRGEHLKDYLCARRRGLLVATFRYRREVSSNKPLFELAPSWDDCGGHWEGQIAEIDAGGGEYGSKVALLEMGRTDVDRDADVPVMGFPSDGSTWSTHHEFARLGPKQYVVIGEMWRNEWVPPGKRSPRLREGSGSVVCRIHRR